MFKIPDWEDDSPNVNISFPKKTKGNKKKNRTLSESPQMNGVVKPKFKAKNLNENNIKAKNLNQKNNRVNNLKQKEKKVNENQTSKTDIKLIDTDKLDELILNEKKQKLSTYKKDDNEEILFNENSENIIKAKPQLKESSIITNKIDKERNPRENVTEMVEKKDEKKEKIVKKTKLQICKPGNRSNSENKITKNLNQQIKNKKVKKKLEKIQDTILHNGSHNNSENEMQEENKLQNNNIAKKKAEKKKEALKLILEKESNRTPINVNSNKLRERMLERLKAAQFRYLNEKLYTSSGSDARQLFQEDPAAFQVYHEGYQQQVKRWPVKPLDVIIKRIQKMPKTHKIADMGCGEAELSTRVVQTVRSFDLVASKPGVETCDMAHTPLLSASMDVAIYCLALMGTDLTQYLVEANRILKSGGHLLIAEVESRFHDVDSFIRDVQKLGFTLKKLDKSQQVFFFMEFTKAREAPVKKAKMPAISLKPCIYKKR